VVDTHCHLDLSEAPAAEQVERARAAGVSRLGSVGIDPASARRALEAARAHEEVRAIVGLHPNSAAGFTAGSLREHAPDLAALAGEPEVCAVGETGLDYFRDRAPRADQRRAFEAHIELARELDLPLVIHSREAADDTFGLLAEHAGDLSVVLHCFSAPERLEEAVERGYMCSFAGNVTYPSATELQDAAERVPDHLLLVETDSPFLSPQPVRGRQNEPANVTLTARFIAERRGVAYEELDAQVEANAARVFGW